MSFAVSRAVVRQSRFAVRRAGIRNASTTSEATGAAKEKASQASSKASEGLTRVKSSAASAASSVSNAAQNAASSINSAASKVQGRTGRMIGFVQGKSCFLKCEGGAIGCWDVGCGEGGERREGCEGLIRLNGAVGERCAATAGLWWVVCFGGYRHQEIWTEDGSIDQNM